MQTTHISKLPRPLLAFLVAATIASTLAVTLAVASAKPASAYGRENWEIAFSATGNAPGTGMGFGFWGWCGLGGGGASGALTGNDGDCQVEQYTHLPAGGGFNCHESLDITAWDGTGGTFLITGTASVNPVSETGPCLQLFPGSASFSRIDTMFPAAPGHYNFGALAPGLNGKFQVQVNEIP
jgi:hypothetical protein